jgi:hypothetical protein
MIAASREHLKQAGYGGGWRGYRAHARHAWARTFELARILWWSAAHALIPGAYRFRARDALVDLATVIMANRGFGIRVLKEYDINTNQRPCRLD